MCGIAGFVDLKKLSSEAILWKQTETLHYRGPDGGNVYFLQTEQAQVGLGHRRLSIIDLSDNGTQPMHFDGLHVVFNGEIYNYGKIKSELEQLGHNFRSNSDTEVILHSIRQWGYEEAIRRWHGMFAMAVFDETSNELVCIRDRAGVKPFYYYFQDGLFLFGSELKALTAHPRFERSIDKDAVGTFLKFGYVSHPHCIWKHACKLTQGHLLRLKIGSAAVTQQRYWDVYDCYKEPKLDLSFEEAVTETERILQRSFNYRMVADVPVGVFLSGGFDSSCVTALLQKDSTEKIRTFTIGTTDKNLDEAPFAKQIAQHLGTEHTEYYCTAKEALDIIPTLPFYYDEPFADSSAIPTILVSRLARKDVTVALSADAGDEIFAGYYRYEYIQKYWRRIDAIPKPARKLLESAMRLVPAKRLPYVNKLPNFYNRYEKLVNLLDDPSPQRMMSSLTQVFTEEELKEVFAAEHRSVTTAHDRADLLEGGDVLSYMLAVDYQTYMCDDILQKVDRATMSVGLEGREPFLDQDIIEWAARLPNSYKYHKGEKKYILKQIVYKYLPKELMDRKKMGFAIPVADWMQNELKELVHEYLSENALDKHGLFDKQYVNRLTDNFFAGRTELNLKIWYLLMFQMWYQEWMKA